MIQLYLNNRLLHVSSQATIKVTAENPMYASGNTYTYEVELPMAIPSNRDFFGYLDRLDVSKKVVTYGARLMADNRTVLIGKAVLTQVTDKAVKVQLLGEGAAYNFTAKSNNLYIDELPLGGISGDKSSGSATGALGLAEVSTSDNLYNGKAPYYLFPIENTSAGLICNNWSIFRPSGDTRYYAGFPWMTMGVRTKYPDGWQDEMVTSPQPALWYMVKLISEATGQPLSDEDNLFYRDPFLHRIFIAAADGYAAWNRSLPHWTVGEWWQQIEQTFGIVAAVKADGSGMQLMPRNTYYSTSAASVFISEVLDEYTTEIDSDEQTDASVCNTGFAEFETDSADRLPEGVIDMARFNDSFADIHALQEYVIGLADRDSWLESVRDTVFRCHDGRQYIYFRYLEDVPVFAEVNKYRDRIVSEDTDEVAVELKFVPCRVIDYEVPVLQYQTTGYNTAEYKQVDSVATRILSRPDRDSPGVVSTADFANPALEDLLAEDAEDKIEGAESSVDLIYLGIAPETNTQLIFNDGAGGKTIRYPVPWQRSRLIGYIGETRVKIDGSPQYSLSINYVEGEQNLYSQTLAGSVIVNTRIRHCIKFVSEVMPDPSAIFVIRNKRFVCEKIEVDLKPEGMSKVVTGYFYELEL